MRLTPNEMELAKIVVRQAIFIEHTSEKPSWLADISIARKSLERLSFNIEEEDFQLITQNIK